MRKKDLQAMKELPTRWTEKARKGTPLPEYPRPQCMRDAWRNLNGLWNYAVTENGKRPDAWDGEILVPFAPECMLSGVLRTLRPGQTLWYRRTFRVPEAEGQADSTAQGAAGQASRTLLHFGAVDQRCAVYVNGRKAGEHAGGYLPFTIEITDCLKTGENVLAVAVRDDTDGLPFARGKQRIERGGMYYTPMSGIWQTVWLETVPSSYIVRVNAEDDGTARMADGTHAAGEGAENTAAVRFRIRTEGCACRGRITVYAPGLYNEEGFDPQRTADLPVTAEAAFGEEDVKGGYLTACVRLPEAVPWTQETPYLYYYTVWYGDDRVTGYFALRSVSIGEGPGGHPAVLLNGHPVFLKGVLDQGVWPDGLYTAPADDALLFDIRKMREAGFNMARKHAKIEAERWYYHCDRTGLLVMQDMVNGGEKTKSWYVTYLATALSAAGLSASDRARGLLGRGSRLSRRLFEEEMWDTIEALRSHPSIISWVLFNEGWGQYDTVRLTKTMRELDPSRLIDAASGWYDQGSGDFRSVHWYFFSLPFRTEAKRAFFLSEFGGLAQKEEEHSACEGVYGYRVYDSRKELNRNYYALMRRMEALRKEGLSGYVYTQWSDVEEEINGVYTYDREVKKLIIRALPDTTRQDGRTSAAERTAYEP